MKGRDGAYLSVLALEKVLHILQLLLSAEAGCAELHHRAQHTERRRQTLVDGIPVVLQPGPASVDTRRVATETTQGHVDVLVLDLVAAGQVESALDQGGVFGGTQAAEGRGLLIGSGGIAEAVEDDVVLLLATVLQHNAEYAAANVGVDGVLVAGGEPLEHVLGGLDDDRVLSHTGTAEHQSLELLQDVAILLREFPSELVRLVADQRALEGLQGVPGGDILEQPSSPQRANTSQDLVPHDELSLAVEALQQRQQAGGALEAGRGQGTGIGNHTGAVLDAQKSALGRLTQFGQTLRSVRGAVDGGVVRVELEEVKVGHLEFALALGQHGVLVDAILGAQTQHDGVERGVLIGADITGAQETVLLQLDGGVAGVLRDSHNGETDFLGPDVHDLLHGLATGVSQGGPQITGLGVSVGVLLDVVAHTLDEDILTHVLGDHAQNGGSLGVGDGIKDLVDLVGTLHGHLNRVTAAQRIQGQGALQGVDDIRLPDLPLGEEAVARVPGHPGGETLVEPEAIPEVHGDQVTEPLVGQLVLDGLGNTLLAGGTAGLLIQQHVHDTVGDQTPVLHGTSAEVGHGDHVHLGQGELVIERLLVEGQSAGGQVQGEATVLNILIRGSIDTDGDAESLRLDVVEVADNEGEQVSRHDRGGVELHSLLAAGNLGLTGDVHVAQTCHALVCHQGHGELGLQGGLVEAGEGAAGISRLHLGGGNVLGLTIGSLVGGAVETGHVVVELTSEGQLQLGGGTGGDGVGELDGRNLLVLVEGDLGVGGHDGALGGDDGIVDLDLVGVERDGGGIFSDVETIFPES